VKTPSYSPSSHVGLASGNRTPTSPSVATRGLSVGRGKGLSANFTLYRRDESPDCRHVQSLDDLSYVESRT
jgi:hypothetical protein